MVGTTSRNHRDRELQNILSTLSPPSSATQCSLCASHNLLPEHAALANRPCNRKTCLQSDPSKCFGSKPTNRRRCPNGICSRLYDGIVRAHQYKDPLWRNTDPTTWCSDIQGWSFGGKCYQTTPNLGKSADETDAAGLLSVILNNTYFQGDIYCNLAVPGNYFATARNIRNAILFRPKLELDDSQLQSYLDMFIKVLQDKKKLLNDAKAKEAVNKLVELKKITIEESSLVQRRQVALSAPEQLQEKKTEVMKGLEEKKTEVLNAVDSAQASASGIVESNDVHKRLTETEEAIKILTDTEQQKKPSNSESREVDESASSENLQRAAKEKRTPAWDKLFHDSNHVNNRSTYICHNELELLYDFISKGVDMRQIELWNLDCSDHGTNSCSGLSLDLSQHSQLRELSLGAIPCLKLNINMASLEWCELYMLSLSSLKFTRGTCDTVNSELNIRDVRLWGVTTLASVLQDFVNIIQTLPHTVYVLIGWDCDITPKDEWDTLKHEIETSQHFTVHRDAGGSVFVFESIKHCN